MSHIKDRLIQLKNEVENTGNGAYFSKNNISKIVELLLTDLEQDEKENGWISVKYHQISEKEREEESISRDIRRRIHFKRHYMLDCKMPDDGQEILATNGKTTWQDTSFIDCDGYYLDSNYDWIEITAWRPLPEPYKED